jgi:hypothetical protein
MGRDIWYGLDGRPINVAEASRLLRTPDAIWVAKTFLTTDRGRVEVSTVFLVVDHNWSGEGPPVLWESMTFGGPADGAQRRYTSRDAAVVGHAEQVAQCRAALEAEGVRVLSVDHRGAGAG